MEATYIHASRTEARFAANAVWQVAKSACSTVARALAEGARGDVLDRTFTTSSSAQFAALPRGQQNRLLDCGFRP